MEGAAAPATESTASAISLTGPSFECVSQRLARRGVPAEYLEIGPAGLVEFVNRDRALVSSAVSALFPNIDEIKEAEDEFLSLVNEAVLWVQWLVFEDEPKTFLAETCLINGGQRGICGAVWGGNDIAYRCRTCEHDATCAICVPCFRAGDHRDHDYSMIRTGGGCCDCGDATAWKQAGFCTQHRGPGHVPSLPTAFVNSASPVLEALFAFWVSKLNAAQAVSEGTPKTWSLQTPEEKVASQISLAIIQMFLDFCNSSESLLNFTAKLAGMKKLGILDTVLRTESFLPLAVVDKLHELLYKLLGVTAFKYSFAQAFIIHYPKFLQDSVREDLTGSGSNSFTKHREHAILGNFSVQIFTVPTITPMLVRESKLLDMLLKTLQELFLACVGDDGKLLVSKGPIVHRLYSRVLEDIRYVMSHVEVAQYVAQHRPELAQAWLELVAFVQGIYPQRRLFNVHVEEENEDWDSAYYLEVQMAIIHPLFVVGAATGTGFGHVEAKSTCDPMILDVHADDESDVVRHAKLSRVRKEKDGMNVASSSVLALQIDDVTLASCVGFEESHSGEVNSGGRGSQVSMDCAVPAELVWLISECIGTLDRWLASDVSRELLRGLGQPTSDVNAVSPQRRGIWRGRATGFTRGVRTTALFPERVGPTPVPPSPAEVEGAPGRGGIQEWLQRARRPLALESTGSASLQESVEMDVDTTVSGTLRTWERGGREWWMGSDFQNTGFGASQLIGEDWPSVNFEVSRQDVSFHIPLHRMLAILMQKALECLSIQKERSPPGIQDKIVFLHQLLPDKYQVPSFVAFMMEHPLRLQVLCAQVQAGMWRRNGHTTSTLCDLYRTVPWCEDSLELDLLMLQCCSVMVPPEKFVDRIQTRFGLTEYFTLSLRGPNEYEPSLAKEFLILLIRLCVERGFCGLSPSEGLRRELVQRLAVGDATHSSLVKALPRRLQDNRDLEDCLKAVAVYRNPSGMQQGKYSLRDECWCELDLYHPRWSPREIQSAEDRYLRACKTSPVYLQLPRWKMPFAPLQTIGRFIISENVHDILRSVFFHAAFSNNFSASRAPEGLLLSALHLLALALDVCSLTSASHRQRHEGHEDHCMSSGESLRFNLMDIDGTRWSVLGLSDGLITSEWGQGPPLLVKAVNRVPVYGADDSAMSEWQSLVSLLVLLFRKYVSCNVLLGTVAETTEYGIGDLIKSLLLKFADLHKGCKLEIESLLPKILHKPPVTLNNAAGSCKMYSDEKKLVTEAEKRRAMAREHQQSVLAKMKAAQDMFVASLEDDNNHRVDGELEFDEQGDAMQLGEGTDEISSGTPCSLCRDSATTSPLCFLSLVQKSRIVALALKPTPSWERPSSKVGALSGERREISGNLGDGSNEMYSTVDLWNWIQDALADATTRERLLGGEALLEVFRNGLRPGIPNAALLTNVVGMPPVIESEPVEIETDAVEWSDKIDAADRLQVDAPSYSGTWWEQDPGLTDSENWSIREIALATVLAEYVSAVSIESQQQGERELTRTGNAEVSRGGGGNIHRRRVAGRNVMDAAFNTGIGLSDTSGVFLSACGHAVHQDCLDRYFSTLLQRYDSRALFEGVQIVDPDKGEFLCPVCRRLANSIVPVFSASSRHAHQSNALNFPDTSQEHLGELSDSLGMKNCMSRTLHIQQAFQLLSNADSLVSKPDIRKPIQVQLSNSIYGALETLTVKLHGLFNPDREHAGGVHGRVPQSLHLWDVFRYSLMSAELAARTQQAGLCMQGALCGLMILDEAVDARKGSVLPLLLHAAQAVQAQSHQVVLLRLRGVQLLVDSIIHGVSRDLFSEKLVQGKFSHLRQYLDKAENSPDIQFWNHMADPVLLHDPFSSLIWLLFCLPLPIPSMESPFTALVHLFYLVCMTQVIAYADTTLLQDMEIGSSVLNFMTAVQTALNGTLLCPALDSENFHSPAGPALTVFRRLTLPFLRQCSLLQKLMSEKGQLLPVASAHLWEVSQRHGFTSAQHPAKYSGSGFGAEDQQLRDELQELNQLESLFSIPPLSAILKDDTVQNVILHWCEHVRGKATVRSLKYIPRPVLAAPFRLMQLPHLFQDLMQRYIKECCPRCKNVPDKPALCLFCGTLCCAHSARPCCSFNRQGECYRHALACGAGIGVFLMLRKTNILLQRCERQALWPSPYLDAFGEEDLEQRGKPLFLSEERYAALTTMVASHGLDYSSLVLAQTSRQMF